MQRRLRTSVSFVAGAAAMVVALAVLGLVHLVQASFPFPPLGLAQRLLRLVPGPVAVFFIERLGHWALRSFAVGFTVGGIAVGGLAGVVVGRVGAWHRLDEQGEADDEFATFSWAVAPRPDGPAVHLDEALDQGEADPQPALGMARRPPPLNEHLEDAG